MKAGNMAPLSPDDSDQLVDAVKKSWPFVAIAVLGGLSSLLEARPRSVWYAVGELVVSGVAGLLGALCMYGHDFSPYEAGAICGVLGKMGHGAFKLLERAVTLKRG